MVITKDDFSRYISKSFFPAPVKKGEPPSFTIKLEPCEAVDGDEVEFTAKINGTDPINLKWLREGKPLQNKADFEQTYVGGIARLVIAEVFPDDSGSYTIEVSNEWGQASSTAQLTVKGNRDI